MRLRSAIGVALAVTMVAAACGERGDDPSQAGGTTEPPSSTPTVPTDTAPTDTGPTDSTPTDGTTVAPPAPGPGDFGLLEDVCGPNEGGGEIPALGDDEIQGLSADTIKVTTIADPGFQGSPGLNQEIFDAGEAFVAWCNGAGGINGKQIELTLRDARLLEYQPVLEQACEDDFAVVGDGAVQDNLWADVGVACGLIDVAGFSVTPEKSGRAGDDPITTRQVQPVPNPSDQVSVGANLILLEEFDGTADRTAFLYADFATLLSQYDKERAGFEEAGHTVVHTSVYNILGEDNWTPFAAAIRGADVEFLRFIGEPDNGAQLKAALAEIDFSPAVTLHETNFYDANYIVGGGDAVEGDFVRTAFWPFEEAATNPATARYLELLEAQGGKVAVLGVQSMSAWLLFATLAKACDVADNLSRTCILEGAAELTEWTGGGLHAPTSPATNEGSDCVVVMQVSGGQFVRWAPEPEIGYACDPGYTVQIDPGG